MRYNNHGGGFLNRGAPKSRSQSGGRNSGSTRRPTTKSNLLYGVAGLGVSALAGLWANAAFAAPPQSTPAAATEVETVIVTATKRKENLQNVPIAVSAFTAKDIAVLGDKSVQDLSAPNFVFPHMATSSLSYISIRGIFQVAANPGITTGVSEYVDGVYTGRNISLNTDLSDVDRVEILYGPQGTLFGKNTIAGAINITTKQPGPNFGGDVEAEVGSLDLLHLVGSVNLPVVPDVLAVRFSGETETRDGYVKDVVAGGPDGGGINLSNGRAQILYTPTSNFSLTASLDSFQSHNVGTTHEDLQGSTGPTIVGAPYTYYSNVAPQESKHDEGASVTAEYRFGNGYTLTSITAARETRTRWLENDDDSSYDLYVEDLRTQEDLGSEELRISSPTGGRFDYVAGLYYYNEEAAYYAPLYIGPLVGGPFDLILNDRIRTIDYAGYVHANFHVTSAFNLFGGLRYTDESQALDGGEQIGASTFNPTTAAFNNPGPFIGPLNDTAEHWVGNIHTDQLNWEAGAEYHFTPDIMSYAKVSTGFKGGGFNLQSGTTVMPEHLTNYEVGTKTGWFNNRLSVDAAAFYNDYTNLQVRSECVQCLPPVVLLTNAAGAVSKGFDVELKAVPVENLSVNLGIGYVDSRYSNFQHVQNVFGVLFNATGHELAMSPPWSINGGATYGYPLANGGKLIGHVDANFTDARYGTLDAGQNASQYALPSYTVANARIGYQPPSNKWDVYVWAKNLTNTVSLTDKDYLPLLGPSAMFPSGWAEEQGVYIEPRTYGVTLRARF